MRRRVEGSAAIHACADLLGSSRGTDPVSLFRGAVPRFTVLCPSLESALWASLVTALLGQWEPPTVQSLPQPLAEPQTALCLAWQSPSLSCLCPQKPCAPRLPDTPTAHPDYLT